jgi:hypothetical protein
MKIELELKINNNGDTFLNFWNYANGDDACCKVEDGKLFLSVYDDEANRLPDIEISLNEFIKLVKEKIDNIKTVF